MGLLLEIREGDAKERTRERAIQVCRVTATHLAFILFVISLTTTRDRCTLRPSRTHTVHYVFSVFSCHLCPVALFLLADAYLQDPDKLLRN